MRKIARYGWRPDLPDHRDYLAAHKPQLTLPQMVDLRPSCPPVFDQGDLGSCTANAIAAAMMMATSFADPTPPPQPMLSRLFIYYNERLIEGCTDSDSGAQVRDGFKVIAKYGACLETTWPYDIKRFAIKPDQIAYDEASSDEAVVYNRVGQSASVIKTVLANGSPVVFGFTVYDSFESDEVEATGIVPMPTSSESVVGGHAVVCVGYSESHRWWLVRNSWGVDWGLGGYCWMPYEYLLNPDLASDFWVVNKTT